ncbi:MAG: glycoside hydrolase family 127 protein [Fimbriimonadaceae bacterium]|nr:glycoside hydrolase family 127 protein [Fimbriimonadaceae bacterium]
MIWILMACGSLVLVEPVAPVAPVAGPGAVRLGGLLGSRVTATALGRLLDVDEDALLAGFRRRPGEQAWIGEHVGKFLDAACLAWQQTGDPRLRAKLERVTAGLLACQEADGYLGTYRPADRWTSWDVWVHKYCLVGLLAVHTTTGDGAALQGARRIGELLRTTFGPGGRDLIASGTHVGMAATSVLGPVVRLYRCSGDARDRLFAEQIVAGWSQPHGPHLLESLLGHGRVQQTANAKAYELLSNLVGLSELYRLTGEPRHLAACRRAWDDIAATQSWVTGGTSLSEHFQADHHLPNSGAVSENCAQVTLAQLTAALLELTGEARYAAALENLAYNHLIGSQTPDGRSICYFTPLEGPKPYGRGINCCVSSNPRAVLRLPQWSWGQVGDKLIAQIHGPSRLRTTVGAVAVQVEQLADYPTEPALRYRLAVSQPLELSLAVRLPAGERPRWLLNGRPCEVAAEAGYAVLRRVWRDGDALAAALDLPVERLAGQHGNHGQTAFRRGPLVYSYDEAVNPGLPPAAAVTADEGPAAVVEPPAAARTWPGERWLQLPAVTPAGWAGPASLCLRPFAAAGSSGAVQQVWLPAAETVRAAEISLTCGGRESWSRAGNVAGSICDQRGDTWRVTFDGRWQDLDWYAVELRAPATVGRVVFRHGAVYHDGGWFDRRNSAPRVEGQALPGGPWLLLGELTDYPATTAGSPAGLTPGQPFEVRCAPQRLVAVRVVGVPASGDRPAQSFSSCAELQAWER